MDPIIEKLCSFLKDTQAQYFLETSQSHFFQNYNGKIKRIFDDLVPSKKDLNIKPEEYMPSSVKQLLHKSTFNSQCPRNWFLKLTIAVIHFIHPIVENLFIGLKLNQCKDQLRSHYSRFPGQSFEIDITTAYIFFCLQILCKEKQKILTPLYNNLLQKTESQHLLVCEFTRLNLSKLFRDNSMSFLIPKTLPSVFSNIRTFIYLLCIIKKQDGWQCGKWSKSHELFGECQPVPQLVYDIYQICLNQLGLLSENLTIEQLLNIQNEKIGKILKKINSSVQQNIWFFPSKRKRNPETQNFYNRIRNCLNQLQLIDPVQRNIHLDQWIKELIETSSVPVIIPEVDSAVKYMNVQTRIKTSSVPVITPEVDSVVKYMNVQTRYLLSVNISTSICKINTETISTLFPKYKQLVELYSGTSKQCIVYQDKKSPRRPRRKSTPTERKLREILNFYCRYQDFLK